MRQEKLHLNDSNVCDLIYLFVYNKQIFPQLIHSTIPHKKHHKSQSEDA